MPTVRGRDAVVIALVLIAIGAAIRSCGDSGSSSNAQASAPKHTSVVATATTGSVPVYRKPGGDPWKRMSNPTSVGADRVFLVKGSNGHGWLHVLLPVRPNGSTGWIRGDDVTLTKTTYRVHVYLDDHRVVVKHGKDDVAVKGRIGVGTHNTPTPHGDYYIISLLQTPKQRSPYGPYAFGLSGFSSVLKSFGNGAGRIGLHGTSKPELLGKDVSHGCIRMSNANITKLAHTLPLGTPIYIHA